MGLPVISDSLQSYLHEINRYPVLSAEEEFEVAERYFKHGNRDDAHRLVVSNLRYVVRIALEFRNYGCRTADLIQEGNIGLMVAVKKFNPYKGFRLITYATWWIKSFIQDFILRTTGIVKRSPRALKKRLFYKKGGAIPPIPIGEGQAIKQSDTGGEDAGAIRDLSLDAPSPDEKSAPMDMLADTRPGPVEAVAIKQESAMAKREVQNALALLNEKERLVIKERVMSEEPESLQSIGDKLGLTRERVRQIESSALKKLRSTLSQLNPQEDFLYEPA
ncbi:MAG: sigma-70 family RNA polymerase sigma factor [Deltaproteobacteria bacterium]|nr:sigma-70 family RNA polymerase sigma factor [Deltaproteobacteria bacterium]